MQSKIETKEAWTLSAGNGSLVIRTPEGDEFTPPLPNYAYDSYVEDVALPMMVDGKLSNRVLRMLEKATDVVTRRPLIEGEVETQRQVFETNWKKSLQTPPPAIKYVIGDRVVYELVDEQHAGMAFYRARNLLFVYVVETRVYFESL